MILRTRTRLPGIAGKVSAKSQVETDILSDQQGARRFPGCEGSSSLQEMKNNRQKKLGKMELEKNKIGFLTVNSFFLWGVPFNLIVFVI